MKNRLIQDVKSILFGRLLWLVVIVLALIGYLGNIEMVKQLEDLNQQGQLGGIPLIFAVSMEAIRSDLFLMAVPIFVTLPFSERFIYEMNSRYYLYSISRGRKRDYILSKALMTFLSGFLTLLLTELLLLLIYYLVNIKEMADMPVVGTPFLWIFVKIVTLSLLNGGVWALVGTAGTIIMRSRYFTYTMPFILYYLLTTFQEVYYKNLVFLNPSHWIRGKYWDANICLLVLATMSFMLGLFVVYLMRRRIEHG